MCPYLVKPAKVHLTSFLTPLFGGSTYIPKLTFGIGTLAPKVLGKIDKKSLQLTRSPSDTFALKQDKRSLGQRKPQSKVSFGCHWNRQTCIAFCSGCQNMMDYSKTLITLINNMFPAKKKTYIYLLSLEMSLEWPLISVWNYQKLYRI